MVMPQMASSSGQTRGTRARIQGSGRRIFTMSTSALVQDMTHPRSEMLPVAGGFHLGVDLPLCYVMPVVDTLLCWHRQYLRSAHSYNVRWVVSGYRVTNKIVQLEQPASFLLPRVVVFHGCPTRSAHLIAPV